MISVIELIHSSGELLLCLDVDCDLGLEVDGEVILEDSGLGDVPWDHRLVHDNVA